MVLRLFKKWIAFAALLLSIPMVQAEECPHSFAEIAHPEINIESSMDAIQEEASSAAKKCGTDVACIQKKLEMKFPKKFWESTCLVKNPAAQSSLLYNMAVSTAMIAGTYAASHADHLGDDQKDFPIFFLMNTIAWAPVFSEVACRNQLSTDETDTNQALGLHGHIKNFGKSSKRYALWIAGASTTGLVADEFDHARKEGDQYQVPPPQELAKLLGTYLVFNVGVSTVRNVLILDPLYLKTFPWMKTVIENLVKQKVITQVILVPAEFSARTLIGAANRLQFTAYRDWVRKQLEKEP